MPSTIGALRKTPLFSQLFLCLSRACLGKMIVFIPKRRPKGAFFAPVELRELGVAGRVHAVVSSLILREIRGQETVKKRPRNGQETVKKRSHLGTDSLPAAGLINVRCNLACSLRSSPSCRMSQRVRPGLGRGLQHRRQRTRSKRGCTGHRSRAPPPQARSAGAQKRSTRILPTTRTPMPPALRAARCVSDHINSSGK